MFTYPGAEHSRFTHSLGVMHLMSRALDLLGARRRIDAEARMVGRVGALLHDLGHGPFSHLIEKVFRFRHEDWTRRIILDEGAEVNRILRSYDPDLPARLISLYDHVYTPAFISQLVSSQLDCDRMDYLLRDSFMTGVKYGIYDLEWVLHALAIDEGSDRLYVEMKGLHAVEEYLQARYYMFRQVYFHRTLRSAEAVLVSALARARHLIERGKAGLLTHAAAFEKMLVGKQVTAREYLQLDDTNIIYSLKEWSQDSDPILADLARRFVDRKLFKAADLDLRPDRVEHFWKSARQIVRAAGLDPEYYLIKDRAADIPYYGYYLPGASDPEGLIYISSDGRAVREISEVSEVVRGMRAYTIDRVCFPPEVSDEIMALLADNGGQ
jgi:HD superfamily phosphohydrolase